MNKQEILEQVKFIRSLLADGTLKITKEFRVDDVNTSLNKIEKSLTQKVSPNAEEVLNSKPYVFQGLDKFYGHQTVLNAMQEYSQSNAEATKKSAEEIYKLMVDNMPFVASESQKPYILEAINIALKSNAEAKWISVDERLPEDFKTVLAYGNNITSVALYQENVFYSDFEVLGHNQITHWMPLPQLPNTLTTK